MTSDIVSVEIGRSTWQGPSEEAPQRAARQDDTVTMTYRNYRGEVDQRTVEPIYIWFGSTKYHPEPGWLMHAKDLAKGERRDFALADCQFSDLCASGQQVRVKPLEWEDFDERGAKANGLLIASYLIVRWSDGQFEISVSAPGYSTGFDGERFHPTLEASKAAAQADYERRIIAALTPAPQPEGHPDDLAVDRFATAMKAKLAKKRAEGRSGWDRKDECSAEDLTYMLVQHIWKGDPLDVGNLAMMLHQRGERIVIDSETRSIAQTADWRDDPAVAAAFGVDFTAHPPERGRDVQETRVATREETLAGEILAELTRARAKFPGKNVTFAALVEEVGELATATFEEGADRVRKEAVQVAVMAMRMILDGDHCYEPWRAEKGLDPLDPELRAQAEGRDNG